MQTVLFAQGDDGEGGDPKSQKGLRMSFMDDPWWRLRSSILRPPLSSEAAAAFPLFRAIQSISPSHSAIQLAEAEAHSPPLSAAICTARASKKNIWGLLLKDVNLYLEF